MARTVTLVRGLAVGATLLSLVPRVLPAQKAADPRATQAAQLPAAPSRPAAATLDAAALKGLKWRNIGPANHSGRIADFAVGRAPGVADALYAAMSIGGVWKTTDWGATWDPVFDSSNGMSSIGSVSVAPSNPNVVWVGTGEVDNRQSSYWGDGIYKSVDAGRTWKHMGLVETQHIGSIVIDPTNPDIVYVAALGHLWGANAERGVYKTTDGGETWSKILYVDEHTGASAIIMDPQDPHTLIAAMYQRQRTAWGYNGGGPGSAMYRTNDAGRTWHKLTKGLPEGPLGRIGLDVYRRDGRIVYAVVEADPPAGRGAGGLAPTGRVQGGIFRSTDRGDTWERVNTMNVRPSYFSLVRIDPNDPQHIYYGGSDFYTSHDGGRTFTDPGYGGQSLHPDQHALWIDPNDSNHLVSGNDGGVFFSHSAGQTWRFVDNLPTEQFYDVSVDMRDPYHVCGGLQDNGSWCTPSATKDIKGISRGDAYLVGGGDGYFVQIHPTDPNIVFAEQGGANVARYNRSTGEVQPVKPASGERPTRNSDTEEIGPFRGNWDSPMLLSSHDPKVLYVGMNKLFRTNDLGRTWTAISPDLTLKVNRDTLQMMGTRVPDNALSRHDGISTFSTLTAIGESPIDAKVMYTGSDDGQIQVTRDGGTTWKNVTGNIPGLPPVSWVSWVEPSKASLGRVYAAFDGHRSDDFHAHLYVSNDFGLTWRSITNGLPATPMDAIREHPRNPNLLFAGHARGMSVSIDGGENWASLNTNFPSVPVTAMVIHPRDNDLVVSTFGRSFWILDDLGALESLTPVVVASGDHVLAGKPGRLSSFYFGDGWFWAGYFVAPNPEYGAAISYWLSAPAKSVHIRITDASGKLLRTLEGPGQTGVNRIYWDMHMESAERVDPKELYNPVFRPPPEGPPVLPGNYTAVISVAGRGEMRSQLTVLADPLITISDADRQSRQKALLDIYAMERTWVTARDAMKTVTAQLATLRKQFAGTEGESRPAVPEELNHRLTTVSDSVRVAERLITSNLGVVSGLAKALSGYTGLPTESQMKSIGWAREDMNTGIAKVNALLQKDLPDLYAALQAGHVWPSPVRAIPIIPPPSH
jgi:photosystem II stability/assembly factor-like uncharacterized protein